MLNNICDTKWGNNKKIGTINDLGSLWPITFNYIKLMQQKDNTYMTLIETQKMYTRLLVTSSSYDIFKLSLFDFIATRLINYITYLIKNAPDKISDSCLIKIFKRLRYYAISQQIINLFPNKPQFFAAPINYSKNTPYALLLQPNNTINLLPNPRDISNKLFTRKRYKENDNNISLLFVFFTNFAIENFFNSTGEMATIGNVIYRKLDGYNRHSSFTNLDAIYGNSIDIQKKLRTLSEGKLRTSIINNEIYPPKYADKFGLSAAYTDVHLVE
jgi:hypothetical protein